MHPAFKVLSNRFNSTVSDFIKLRTWAWAEKFPGDATKKRPKIALLSFFHGSGGWGATEKRPKNCKNRDRKIELLSLYLLYL